METGIFGSRLESASRTGLGGGVSLLTNRCADSLWDAVNYSEGRKGVIS
jgi:hypothetical protein